MHLPPFNVLWRNYTSNKSVTQPELFKEIGWDDVIDNPAFKNTCAIRVSLAFIKSGVKVPGRMRIKKGPYKGELIEMGQHNLTMILKREIGIPEQFSGSQRDYVEGIGKRNRIVSFYHLLPGLYEGGHIDFVSYADGGALKCGSDCHWASKEVLFWPMR